MGPRPVLVIAFFLLINWCTAQALNPPIYIEANEHTTVTLFFSEKILKIVEPGPNFRFDYKEKDGFGTLRASKGGDGNLTVITENGDIFSFFLRYTEEVDNFTYMLSSDKATGSIAQTGRTQIEEQVLELPSGEDRHGPNNLAAEPETAPAGISRSVFTEERTVSKELSKEPDTVGDLYEIDRSEYYRIFCENNYLQKSIFENNIRTNNNIDLKLNHILVDNNEIYFALQVRNVSTRDYKIAGLHFYVKTPGNKELLMKPLYVYNLQDVVKTNTVNKFVYVFKGFRLDPDQKVYAALDELDGSRKVILPLNIEQNN